MKILSYNLRKKLKEGKFKSAVPVTQKDKYKVGQWYWCGYWQKAYKVLHAEYYTIQGRSFLDSVTVEWEDGSTGTHCTRLDPGHDYKLYM